jgi:hypothetical protein
MEYLITYGWAILVISVVLSVLFYLGVLNPSALTNNQCLMPADFACLNAQLLSNGMITVIIQQQLLTAINITAVGCNTNQTVAQMTAQIPAVNLPIGGSSTFSVQCYSNGASWSAPINKIFDGYLVVNYTELQSGLPHTVYGQLIQKVV